MRATTFLAAALAVLLCRAAGAQQQAKPAKLTDEEAKHLAKLIAQLDSKQFAEREQAMKALEEFGERGLEVMAKAAKGAANVEVQRRLNLVIGKLRAPSELERRIADLIARLAVPRFRDREEATNALMAIGRPALEQLRAAARGPDFETARRAEALIKHILKKAP